MWSILGSICPLKSTLGVFMEWQGMPAAQSGKQSIRLPKMLFSTLMQLWCGGNLRSNLVKIGKNMVNFGLDMSSKVNFSAFMDWQGVPAVPSGNQSIRLPKMPFSTLTRVWFDINLRSNLVKIGINMANFGLKMPFKVNFCAFYGLTRFVSCARW